MSDFHLARRAELPSATRYSPEPGVNLTPATGTMTLLQSGGVNVADVTFIFPPSGKVIADIAAWVYSSTGAGTNFGTSIGYFGLMEGASVRMNVRAIEAHEFGGYKRARAVLTGTPGTVHTYSAAAFQTVAGRIVIAADQSDGIDLTVAITPCL